MFKKITKMALVCLAMMCMSSAQSPIIDEPTVRVLFQYNEIIAYAGHPFDIEIFFRNTNKLYVYKNDYYIMQEIPLEEWQKNNPDELQTTYTDVIVEPDYIVEYTIVAEAENGSRRSTEISFYTYPNP